MNAALRVIAGWVERGAQEYVCVTGVHGIMESQRDPQLRRIHEGSGLTVPDGMPAVWAGRFAGAREMQLIRGTDLTLALCDLAARRGWRCFLYGGKPGTPELLAARLRRRFSGLRVTGTFSPPYRALTPAESEEIVRLINSSNADLVLVGLSTPTQERWMAEHRDRLSASVLAGVGAAFDVHAGLRREAPRWIRPLGLEWLYRLVREPRRLWRRYLRSNPAYVVAVLRRRPFLRGGVATPTSHVGSRGEKVDPPGSRT